MHAKEIHMKLPRVMYVHSQLSVIYITADDYYQIMQNIYPLYTYQDIWFKVLYLNTDVFISVQLFSKDIKYDVCQVYMVQTT